MKNPIKTYFDTKVSIRKEQQRLIEFAHNLDPLDPHYDEVLGKIEKLLGIQQIQKDKKITREKVNPNTVLTTVGQVASVVLVVGFEQAKAFTTKAIHFIKKG